MVRRVFYFNSKERLEIIFRFKGSGDIISIFDQGARPLKDTRHPFKAPTYDDIANIGNHTVEYTYDV